MSKFKLVFCLAWIGAAAFSLGACDKEANAQASQEQAEPMQGKERVVAIEVGSRGFSPSRVEAAKGEKTTLRFTRTSDATCAKKVVFPEIKLEKDLPLNQAVEVAVPTDKSRTLVFQCGMGMYKSSVVVH